MIQRTETASGGLPGADRSGTAGGDAGVATAPRGIRGTSAAYGAAYGVLFLVIVLGPYVGLLLDVGRLTGPTR